MNFGNWIVVAFVVFAVFIGTLVTVCVREDISLVSREYYQDELAYQDQIERIQNTRALKEKPIISRINANTFQLRFDQESKVQKGELTMFCPSDPKMDKTFVIKLSQANTQLINVDSFKKGMYRAKLLWTVDNKDFFYEEIIYI